MLHRQQVDELIGINGLFTFVKVEQIGHEPTMLVGGYLLFSEVGVETILIELRHKAFANRDFFIQVGAQWWARQHFELEGFVGELLNKSCALYFEPVAQAIGGVAVVHVVFGELAQHRCVAFGAKAAVVDGLQPLFVIHDAQSAIGHQVGAIKHI